KPRDGEIEMRRAIADVAAERYGDSRQLTNSPIHQLTNLFDPSCRQHFADGRPDLLGAPAQEICPSRERLLEKALVLEGLAQDDAQHAAVAGIGHRLDARQPAIHERLGVAQVGFEDDASGVAVRCRYGLAGVGYLGDAASELADSR